MGLVHCWMKALGQASLKKDIPILVSVDFWKGYNEMH
jgi:hypothetical protein